VEIAGAKVPLQRVSITLPPDVADVAGLTFVLRRWVGWLDGLVDELTTFAVHSITVCLAWCLSWSFVIVLINPVCWPGDLIVCAE
jgi:hypothetical protein